MSGDHPINILIVDDEKVVHEAIGDYLLQLGYQVESAYNGKEALALLREKEFDFALVDLKMPVMDGMALLEKAKDSWPEMPLVIITAHGSLESAVEALKLGASDFLLKPIKLIELDAIIEKSLQIHTLRKGHRRLRDTIRGIQSSAELGLGREGLIGNSTALEDVRQLIGKAVETDCETILISGETGVGKEVVARALHFQAESEEAPFIAVSCPALPDSLAESELFGHVKGAFTGAVADRAGCFELADGGTLFLDEIGDLSTAAQAKILRVLETRSLRRIGGSREIRVSVRIVAASNIPLERLVEQGKFRNDLYYRLSVFLIHLVPLRERREDIIPLAEHFLLSFTSSRSLKIDGFSKKAESTLLKYAFPGNARELRNIVERAAILCRSNIIQAEDLNLIQRPASSKISGSGQLDIEAEKERILAALEETRWNRRRAAEKLGMPYSTLRYKLLKLGIK
jgi:two-component system, NtrC family, response regulator AtoC